MFTSLISKKIQFSTSSVTNSHIVQSSSFSIKDHDFYYNIDIIIYFKEKGISFDRYFKDKKTNDKISLILSSLIPNGAQHINVESINNQISLIFELEDSSDIDFDFFLNVRYHTQENEKLNALKDMSLKIESRILKMEKEFISLSENKVKRILTASCFKMDVNRLNADGSFSPLLSETLNLPSILSHEIDIPYNDRYNLIIDDFQKVFKDVPEKLMRKEISQRFKMFKTFSF